MPLPETHPLLELARRVAHVPESWQTVRASVRAPTFILRVVLEVEPVVQLALAVSVREPLAPAPLGFLAGALAFEMVSASDFLQHDPDALTQALDELAEEAPETFSASMSGGGGGMIPPEQAAQIGLRALEEYPHPGPYSSICVDLCRCLLETLPWEEASERAVVHLGRADHSAALGRYQQTVDDFTAALTTYERLAAERSEPVWRRLVGIVAGNRASAHANLGRWADAEVDCGRAIETLAAFLRLENTPEYQADLARAYSLHCYFLIKLDRLDEALAEAGQAVDGLRAVVKAGSAPDWRNDLASALGNRGHALALAGQLGAALVDHEEAVGVLERLVQTDGHREYTGRLADAYQLHGSTLVHLGRLAAAVAAYDRAREVLRGLKEEHERCAVEANWPAPYRAVKGDELDAEWSRVHSNRGNAFALLGRWEAAVADCDVAIGISLRLDSAGRPDGRSTGTVKAYLNRGNGHRGLGQRWAALDDYTQAVRLSERLPQGAARTPEGQDELASAFANRAIAYFDLGRLEEAIADFDQAIAIRVPLAAQPRWRPVLGRVYAHRGAAHYRAERLEDAIADYGRAIDLYSGYPDPDSRRELDKLLAGVHANRGTAHKDARHWREAAEDYERALALNRRLVAEEGRQELEREQAVYLAGAADLKARQGEGGEAAVLFEEAAALLERTVGRTVTEQERLARLREDGQIYGGAVIAFSRLAASGSPPPLTGAALYGDRPTTSAERAFFWAERGKARNLADLMSTAERAPRNVTVAEYQAFRAAQHRLRDLDHELAALEAAGPFTDDTRLQAEAFQGERRSLVRQLAEMRQRFIQADRAWVAGAEPLTVDGIRETATRARAAVLALWTGTEGTAAVLVLPSGRVDACLLSGLTVARLNGLLFRREGKKATGWVGAYDRFRRAPMKFWLRNNWHNELEATLRALGEQLWHPLRGWLADRYPAAAPDDPRPLVLLAGPGLTTIPLHALSWEEGGVLRRTCDEYRISYAPSLWVLDRCLQREQRQRGRLASLLAVRNPTGHAQTPALPLLPGTEREVDWISRLFASARVLGHAQDADPATRQRLREALPRHPVALFCTHGTFNSVNPWAGSGLYTADPVPDNGSPQLSLADISQMDLSGLWLAVLSACESALTDVGDSTGEQMGLPSALLAAGATTVVGSLWLANDRTTALLMRVFFEELFKAGAEGMSKGLALWRAQRWLRTRSPEEVAELLREIPGASELTSFEHPAYWSAFSCYGAF